MTRPAQNRYRTSLRELKFVLFEQLGLEEILGKPSFSNWGCVEVELALAELDRFLREVIGLLNAIGDEVGCRLEDG